MPVRNELIFLTIDVRHPEHQVEGNVMAQGRLRRVGSAALVGLCALATMAVVGPVPQASADPVATVTVSKTSNVSRAGETVTVTGSGFDPAANTGTRPPLAGEPSGVYVVFGRFADTWRPSDGAASSARRVLSQLWALPQASYDAVETLLGNDDGLVLLESDGSFTATLEVDADDTGTGNFGIYTYAGSGAVNADQETFTAITFADPPTSGSSSRSGGSSQSGGQARIPATSGGGTRGARIETSAGPVAVTLQGGESGDGATVGVEVVPSSTLGDDDRPGLGLVGKVFDVTTDGDYDEVEVCVPFDPADLPAGTSNGAVQLLHFPEGGEPEVVTTRIGTDQVCGRATSLSPFAPAVLRTSRLAGSDAAATAAAIATSTFEPGVPVAYVVTRGATADALGAGPATGGRGPVLLTDAGTVPVTTLAALERLAPARIVVVGGVVAVGDAVLDALGEVAPVRRLAGTDRYATAAALSADSFGPGVGVVHVVDGHAVADGLVAGAAAAMTGGPVLLVDGGTVPTATRAELERLAPARIVVVGGAAAVPEDVVTALGAIAPVSRLAGADRYATAAAVAASFPAGSPVVVASGTAPSDGLAGVPAAAATGAALVLVPADAVPVDVALLLDGKTPSAVTVLGGTAAVSATVEARLARHVVAR
jgi:putative cell wall-binding protein